MSYNLRRTPYNEINISYRYNSIEKGNQPKIFINNNTQVVKSDYFLFESVTEVLVSEFLRACNEPYFVEYSVYNNDITKCVSNNFIAPGIRFIPFYIMLQYAYKTKSEQQVDKMLKSKYSRLSAVNKYAFVSNVFQYFGVSEQEIDYYFSRIITLDTIMYNVDRHLNNFGILYDVASNKAYTMPIFDNGLALGTTEQIQERYTKTNFNKLKVQPFATSLRKNSSVVTPYAYNFSTRAFMSNHKSLINRDYTKVPIDVFINLVSRAIPTDIEGYNTRQVLNDFFNNKITN